PRDVWTHGTQAAEIRIRFNCLPLPLGGSDRIAEHGKHRGEEEAFRGCSHVLYPDTCQEPDLPPAGLLLHTLSAIMKSYTDYLTFNIPSQMAFVNITPQVQAAVKKSGVQEGLVLVNSMHITSSVFINDDERGLHHDFGVWLENLAP